jgi:membrane protein required for colicin V production
MNFVDIFVVAVIGFFAFMGFWKGFVVQLFHAAGIFCAFYFNTPVSTFISERMAEKPEGIILLLVGIASFFIIFAAFYIAGTIVSKSVNMVLTSLPNRIAGIVFGGIKGFLVVTVIFLAVRSFGGDELLKKHVTPDRFTDNLIEKGKEYSGLQDDSETPADLNNNEERASKVYSKLGYGAYRISMMMDPFVNNIKSMFSEKYDEVIEEKIRDQKEELLND